MDRLTLAANLICTAPLSYMLVYAKEDGKPEKVTAALQLALDLADQLLELEAAPVDERHRAEALPRLDPNAWPVSKSER